MRAGRAGLIAVIAAAAGFGALTVAVWQLWAPLIAMDQKINTRAYEYGLAHPDWVDAWKFITHLGDSWFLLLALAVTLIVLLALRRPRLALAAFVAIVLSQVVFRSLRTLVGMPRPSLGFVLPDGPGYPSGHTMGAATGAVLLVLLVWPVGRVWLRAGVLVLALLWAGAVGMSRPLLGAHWPADVLGAWLLALALVGPVYVLMARDAPSRPFDDG